MSDVHPNPANAFERAISVLGPVRTAAALGVTKSGLYQFKGRVPAERCPAIERLTGVPVEQLRPDLDWQVVVQRGAKSAVVLMTAALIARGVSPKKVDSAARETAETMKFEVGA